MAPGCVKKSYVMRDEATRNKPKLVVQAQYRYSIARISPDIKSRAMVLLREADLSSNTVLTSINAAE